MSSTDREDSYNGQQLLRDIKEVSKALYLNNNPPQRPLLSLPPPVRSRSLASVSSGQGLVLPSKKKKSSVAWDWKKPLKAIAHLRQRRFDVCFHLHVHSIEGMPSNLDGTKLVVEWKRKDEVVSSTQPSSVSQGTAEFEETLTHRCSVYGSRHGPHRSAKYEQKLFLVCVSPVDAPWVVLGKHWVDLARILPLSLEEMEGGRRSTRKWNTSFKLLSGGVADSAVLNLGFDYSVVTSSVCDSTSGGNAMLRRVGSVPSMERRSSSPLDDDDGKVSHQLSPNLSLDLSRSVDLLYEKLSEQNQERSTGTDSECEHLEKANVEQGVETDKQADDSKESSEIEIIDVLELLKDEDEDAAVTEEDCFVDQLSVAELLKSSESSFEIKSSSAVDDSTEGENFLDVKSSYKAAKISTKSRSLDDITESVANDFLNMLELEARSYVYTSDSEPTSPREYLLREFEKEALASGNCLLDLGGGAEYLSDIDEEPSDFSFSSSSVGETKREGKSQLLISRRNAKVLEDLETETLMREWDLDDNSVCSDGFGSPIELPVDEGLDLPPLGDNIGSFVWTKGGGCIRSMSPLLFRKCKDASRLIMQVSVPVVLVPELGSDVLEILQSLATSGTEGLCSEINALMPLEDIVGKPIHEVIEDTKFVKKPSGQLDSFPLKENFGGFGSNMCSSYVPIDALASLAIDGIEILSVEGLRIQCSMTDQDPPSVTAPKPMDQSEALELISHSLPLDEWLRLDHGKSDTGDQTSDGKGNTSGNKLTLALRVLLRDPLRCHEPVGASMLALIQVERSLVSSNPPVCSLAQEESFRNDTHLWRIIDICLAGLKTEPGVDHPWCTKTQQESGSRWLLASGTFKTINGQASNSKAIVASNPQQATRKNLDTLWSIRIDSRHNQEGDLSSSASFVPLTRNSDVIFSDETTKGL
ncbi:Protein PLASTID MOVEMENT IMPAIRED 1-RELATED 2 [Hirschfeldia incana]|nr:Protein PLASTID MOVEMENT IMPAIRED 1-RELATED 2 [Hirschfeldia incana]